MPCNPLKKFDLETCLRVFQKLGTEPQDRTGHEMRGWGRDFFTADLHLNDKLFKQIKN